MVFNKIKKTFRNKYLIVLALFPLLIFVFSANLAKADVLDPSLPVITCGELFAPSIYTLDADIRGISNTCFDVSSDEVTIDGAGYGIYSATGTTVDLAVDARVHDSLNGPLTNGANAYSNLLINNLTVSGFTTLVNASGNADTNGTGSNNGYGGNGGDVAIYYSTPGDITANGGNTSTYGYGGSGGNITITDIDLNLSNKRISLKGGEGNTGMGVNGGLIISYSGIFNQDGLVLGPLSFLNINGVIKHPNNWTPYESSRLWQTIASSADGKKLVSAGEGEKIYTSTDGGLNWISRDSVRSWTAVSSSADGSKLVAVDSGGYIYTSSDSGISWAPHGSAMAWQAVVSSSDGKRIMATVRDGEIYISKNYGQSWTVSNSPVLNWKAISSSADGMKAVAVADQGQIYSSLDGGLNWSVSTSSPSERWNSVSSSADGKYVVAGVYGGRIYNSSDYGNTWILSNNYDGLVWALGGNHFYSWQKVSSSADGKYIFASIYGGNIYSSSDYGDTWVLSESSPSIAWTAITNSADGNISAGVSYGGKIYVLKKYPENFSIDAINPANKSVLSSWSPYISWGAAVTCQYAMDGDSFATTSCLDNGANIPRPSIGNHTLHIKGIDANGNIILKNSDFSFVMGNIILRIFYNNTNSWVPRVTWDESGSASLKSCLYSYDNWDNSIIADCAKNGTDILPPAGTGSYYLYIKTIDTNDHEANSSLAFSYTSGTWEAKDETRNWFALTSSSNGMKLAAVVIGGNIYTSADGGLNWSPRGPSNGWYGIASSADGSKLIAVGNYALYISSDSGDSWTPRGSYLNWFGAASSADGQRLYATDYSGKIYRSSDYGVTWEVAGNSPLGQWSAIDCSSDGMKLVATPQGGHIYTSSDYGNTWSASPSSPSGNWQSVTSSADGSKLVAVANGGYVYYSTNSGADWSISNLPSSSWWGVSSSADGKNVIASVFGSKIYYSSDYGATFTVMDSSPTGNWVGLALSSTGNKMAGVMYGGTPYIYQVASSGGATLDIEIISPVNNSSVNSWSPQISWGIADTCEYAIDSDSFASTSCLDNGANIPKPSIGAHTLHIKGVGGNDNTVTKDSAFTLALSNSINSLSLSGSPSPSNWSPAVTWDGSGAAVLKSCLYSYDNWNSTSTAVCAKNGGDISPPNTEGVYTLYIKSIDENDNEVNSSMLFSYFSWTSHEGNRNWFAITASADLSKIAAAEVGGQIYMSADGGSSWPYHGPSNGWYGISSSADGTKLVAAGGYKLYTSDDSGQNWTLRDSSQNWFAVASSYDGKKLAAAPYGGKISLSTDSGISWHEADNSPYGSWSSISSSADGSKLVATPQGGHVYTSHDSGFTWSASPTSPVANWQSVNSSSDGSKLVALANSGFIFYSTNSGDSWYVSNAPSNSWWGVDSSSDGKYVNASIYGSKVYSSSDYGATWSVIASSPSGGWVGLAVSTDGNKLVGINNGGKIYTYQKPSPNLYVDILGPSNGDTVSLWSPYISWSTAVTCQYAMDGDSFATTSCLDNGANIPRPSVGSHTLHVKGIDIDNNVDIKDVNFDFSAYVWCGTSDSDWTNANNWFKDLECSVPANSPPDNSMSAYLTGIVSPIVTEPWTVPAYIDTTGLSGSASRVGVIFSGSATNTVGITGNATFNDYSHNEATIIGDVILNTTFYNGSIPTSSVLIISGSKYWSGNVTNNIYASDGNTKITSFAFSDSAVNKGLIKGNPTFNNNSVNNGTVVGNPVFNNLSPFPIGNVVGTVNLSKSSQTISGGTATNLVKSSVVRDTLYLTSGSVLNVNNITLLGASASNLLTIRSTVPGISATLRIVSTSTSVMDFLHLKDISNTGQAFDLRGKTAFDDGGNSGFIFNSNSAAGAYTSPSLSSRAPSYENVLTARATLIEKLRAAAKALVDALKKQNNPQVPGVSSHSNQNYLKTNDLGTGKIFSILPPIIEIKPLALKGIPLLSESGNGKSFSLVSKFSDFLFTPFSKSVTSVLNNFPQVKSGISSLGISYEKDLFDLIKRPLELSSSTSKIKGIYRVSSSKGLLNTYLTYDEKKGLYEYISVKPEEYVKIDLSISATSDISGEFNSETVKFKGVNNGEISLVMNAPLLPGDYVLSTKYSPFPLILRVAIPIQSKNIPPPIPEKKGWFRSILSWFGL